jgi:tetratricopeptide (TPR) repeat protein
LSGKRGESSIAPSPITVYNNRANARSAKGDYEGALADYDQALALNPRYAEVYANRGVLRLWLKKTSEAEADFARCVALDPDMKSSLEQRINQLQAQFPIQTRR